MTIESVYSPRHNRTLIMKRILTMIICCVLLLSAAVAQTVYTPDNLPMVHLQDRTRYACNPDGILSPAATDSIDRMLYALEQQTGIQTVVAVVGSIGDADCFDFCHQLMSKRGIGQKGRDNGLIILLVIEQRCIQFYTGYGLEGVLPDAICKRIQTRDMLPHLRAEQWSEAMVAGVRAVCSRLDGSMENDGSSAREGEITLGGLLLLILGLFAIAIAVGVMVYRASSRCPHCGKHRLQRTDSVTLSHRNGVRREAITYTCLNCGHQVIREQESYDDTDDDGFGGRGGGPIIFGGGFGGFGGLGGGGFGGGSFGGGSGGGGGAGTRF